MSETTICPDCHGHPVTYCNGCGKTAGRKVMDLHAQIMNLPAGVPPVPDASNLTASAEVLWAQGYRVGHRDARHAAAELASAQSGRIARLEEALRNLVVMLPSDHEDAAGAARINPGFVYIRWQDLREARAALESK